MAYLVQPERRRRIEQAMAHAKIRSQSALARLVGISQPAIHEVIAGERPGETTIEKIAVCTGVSYEWLQYGKGQAPPWAEEHRFVPQTLGQGLTVYGVVAKASPLEDDTKGAPIDIGHARAVQMPASWVLVEVRGMSAYPILFPGQMGIFDTERAASPDEFTEEKLIDLHDNVVLVSLHTGRAYLKRFCHAAKAPHGYVLASVDAGRSSPYVPPEEISVIMPMVGTLYQDPSKPRQKRWHGKTVIVETPEI